MSESERRALRLVALGLVVGVALTLAPFSTPLVLAAWAADLLQPAVRTLQRVLGGRRWGAAAIVVLFLAAVLLPLVGVVLAVIGGLRDLLAQLGAAFEGRGTLAGVLLGGGRAAPPSLREWIDLASRHGANAWRTVVVVVRTSSSALLAIIVFVVTLYALEVNGSSGYRWLARHSPLSPRVLGRFARAFRETGRGLVIGEGGTALVQGLVATAAYVAIGIPRAMLFGPITAVCALVPVVGTGLVWVPLAFELVATGDYARAGALAVAGVCVGAIDNFIRPVLTRRGHLELPTALVLVSMLGGIATFGASGVLMGPLVVRLAVEALAIARDERLFAARS